MRYIINERQYKLLFEEKQEILHIPSLELFNDDWETLQKFLERRGNPLYSIGGNLNLRGIDIESLGNLTSVGGFLDLYGCKNLTSLGNLTSVGGFLDLYGCKNLTSLGNLTSVGGYLNLRATKIETLGNLTSVGGTLDLEGCHNLTSLGNLTSVGGELVLVKTPISKKYSRDEIRDMVGIGGHLIM